MKNSIVGNKGNSMFQKLGKGIGFMFKITWEGFVIITWPIRAYLKFAWKLIKIVAPFVFLGALFGCAHNSSDIEKSPCACEFHPINIETENADA